MIQSFGCRVLDEGGLLRRNVTRFQGGLVCKAHRLLYHSTLGSREINKNTCRGSNLGAAIFGRSVARYGHVTSIFSREVGERQRHRVLLDPLPRETGKSTSVDIDSQHELTFD